jgi:hypothetical protein
MIAQNGALDLFVLNMIQIKAVIAFLRHKQINSLYLT